MMGFVPNITCYINFIGFTILYIPNNIIYTVVVVIIIVFNKILPRSVQNFVFVFRRYIYVYVSYICFFLNYINVVSNKINKHLCFNWFHVTLQFYFAINGIALYS